MREAKKELSQSPEPAQKRATIEVAILLTVGSALLYALGWTYWTAYFSYFGFPISFMGVSFHQIISTTWWFALPLLMAALHFDAREFESQKPSSYSLRTGDLTFYLLGIGSATAHGLGVPFTAIAICFVVSLALQFTVGHKLPPQLRRLNVGKLLEIPGMWILLSLLGFFIALLVYSFLGDLRAKRTARGDGVAKRITLNRKDGESAPSNAIFVAFIDSKYFICEQTKNGEVPKLQIFNADDVSSVVVQPATEDPNRIGNAIQNADQVADNTEQDGADQSATAPDSKAEGNQKPQPESEGHPQ